MDAHSLAEIFTEQAEWRELKAQEFPADNRNLDAANHLRRLSGTALVVEQSLLDAAEELYEDAPDIEVWQEMLRQEGFNAQHENAEAFVRSFVAHCSSGR